MDPGYLSKAHPSRLSSRGRCSLAGCLHTATFERFNTNGEKAFPEETFLILPAAPPVPLLPTPRGHPIRPYLQIPTKSVKPGWQEENVPWNLFPGKFCAHWKFSTTEPGPWVLVLECFRSGLCLCERSHGLVIEDNTGRDSCPPRSPGFRASFLIIFWGFNLEQVTLQPEPSRSHLQNEETDQMTIEIVSGSTTCDAPVWAERHVRCGTVSFGDRTVE